MHIILKIKYLMNTKSSTSIIASLILLLIIGGCRRGEDDPRISLRSRDARITGTWELESVTGTTASVYYSGGTLIRESSQISFSAGLWTTSGSAFSFSYAYSETLSLQEGNSYEVVARRDGTEDRVNG